MDAPETLEEFYQRKFALLPESPSEQIGHFNLFHIWPFREGKVTTVPYRRRDFYKVMLLQGTSRVYFADKVFGIQKQALAFSNPLIPYKWDQLDKLFDGVYCIFDAQFFHAFSSFGAYEVFQPGGNPVFELTDQQFVEVRDIFGQMEQEFHSDYKYRFDVIRNRILDLIHYGLKLEPAQVLQQRSVNASYRISRMFMELLERQFPVDEAHDYLDLRTPSAFAVQLNIHVNSLNRAVRFTRGKTTSEVINERIVQEAKVLLRHTTWSISDIAFALGFKEVPHFSNFFKKHNALSPMQFRKSKSLEAV